MINNDTASLRSRHENLQTGTASPKDSRHTPTGTRTCYTGKNLSRGTASPRLPAQDKVPELTNNGFEDFIREGFVLIDFFAEWCMPCLMMSPIVDELSEKFKDKIKFGKVNVGENQELAQKFKVSSIPHFIIFKDGEVVEQFIGSRSSEELEEKLRKFVEQ